MEKSKFIYVTHINTSPEKLWEALTKPEFTAQFWMGHRIQSDWSPGAPVRFTRPDGTVDLKGEVLRYDPPKILSYTWSARSCSGTDEGGFTRVTFEITTAYGITKLTVTHEDFAPGSKLLNEVTNGWQAILSSLKTFLETGKPLPFTWKP